MTVKDILSKCTITAGLSDDVLGDLSGIAKTEDYDSDFELVKVGDRSQDLIILASGALEILSPSGEKILRLLPVSLIGEVAFLDAQPRSASIHVTAGSRIVRLDATAMQTYLRSRPDVAAEVYRQIGLTVCRRLRRMNDQVEALQVKEA